MTSLANTMAMHRTSARDIAADPETFRERYVGMRVGLLGASPKEWLASAFPIIYGTLDLPGEGEPIVCFVLNAEGTKMSASPYVLQYLAGVTWLNCYDGSVFNLDEGERVIPLSGVSRMAEMKQLGIATEENDKS